MLYSISQALGAPVTDFFPDGVHATKVTRHDSRENFHFEDAAIIYSRLSTKLPYGALEAFLMTIKPVNQALPTDEFRAHMGEEFCYILEGVLRFWIGDMCYDLHAGDSVCFKSTVKHRFENQTNQPTVGLFLITPSIF